MEMKPEQWAESNPVASMIIQKQQRIAELERELALCKGHRRNLTGTVQHLEKENAELIEQLSCECGEVEQLRAQVARLHSSIQNSFCHSSPGDAHKTLQEALTETTNQSTKALLGQTIELLKRHNTIDDNAHPIDRNNLYTDTEKEVQRLEGIVGL